MKPTRDRACILLTVLLLVFVALATWYSITIPLGEAPDEVPHFTYVRYLAQHGRLPSTTEEHEAFQPPLYYALGAAATFWIEDQPDAPYWRWVARIQRAALSSNSPAISDIDASIYWPSLGRVRRRYRRLLLPCTARDGTRILFSANSSEGRVALRGQVA